MSLCLLNSLYYFQLNFMYICLKWHFEAWEVYLWYLPKCQMVPPVALSTSTKILSHDRTWAGERESCLPSSQSWLYPYIMCTDVGVSPNDLPCESRCPGEGELLPFVHGVLPWFGVPHQNPALETVPSNDSHTEWNCLEDVC